MKNTRKEECERLCERTSQKPDSPAPVQVSDHQHRFRDTALPRSAARWTKERQGGGMVAQKVSQFSESRMNRSRTSVYRTFPIYIDGPSLSQIWSAQIPETAPGTSLRANNRGWCGSLGVVELTKKMQDKNKLLIVYTMPRRDHASSQVTSHMIITRKTWNARARVLVCVMHVHIAAIISFVLSCKDFT
jgi:hypothetical protein